MAELALAVVGLGVAVVSAVLAWLQWQRPRLDGVGATGAHKPALNMSAREAPAETRGAVGAGTTRPWLLPPVGPVVRRDELIDELLGLLIAPGAGAVGVCTAVEGAGGFGKTTLAALACGQEVVRDRFPGGCVWLTVGEAASGPQLADLVGTACEALTGSRPLTADPMVASAALGAALDMRPATLLVLDDVWSEDQLAPFLIGGGATRRLVTTRIRGLLPRGTESLAVDTMSHSEAIAALELELAAPVSRVYLERLVDRTGCWPVLLGLVNASLRDAIADGAAPDDAALWLAGRLDDAGPTALDVSDERTRHRAVASTIAVSIDRLSPAERRCYRRLAIFPEDVDIGADVLELLWQADCEPAGHDAEAVRRRLVNLRLVIGRWTGHQPAVRLHDVIRDYLRHTIGDSELVVEHREFLSVAYNRLVGGPEGRAALVGTPAGRYVPMAVCPLAPRPGRRRSRAHQPALRPPVGRGQG